MAIVFYDVGECTAGNTKSGKFIRTATLADVIDGERAYHRNKYLCKWSETRLLTAPCPAVDVDGMVWVSPPEGSALISLKGQTSLPTLEEWIETLLFMPPLSRERCRGIVPPSELYDMALTSAIFGFPEVAEPLITVASIAHKHCQKLGVWSHNYWRCKFKIYSHSQKRCATDALKLHESNVRSWKKNRSAAVVHPHEVSTKARELKHASVVLEVMCARLHTNFEGAKSAATTPQQMPSSSPPCDRGWLPDTDSRLPGVCGTDES